jgi:hypothetical protein
MHTSATQAPSSVADVRSYFQKMGKEGALRDPYLLPGEFVRGLGDPAPALPEAPVIVLINSKSGGRAGPDCLSALRHALGYTQVRHHCNSAWCLPAGLTTCARMKDTER